MKLQKRQGGITERKIKIDGVWWKILTIYCNERMDNVLEKLNKRTEKER